MVLRPRIFASSAICRSASFFKRSISELRQARMLSDVGQQLQPRPGRIPEGRPIPSLGLVVAGVHIQRASHARRGLRHFVECSVFSVPSFIRSVVRLATPTRLVPSLISPASHGNRLIAAFGIIPYGTRVTFIPFWQRIGFHSTAP